MKTLCLEVRDRMTFIPVLAIQTAHMVAPERLTGNITVRAKEAMIAHSYLLNRSGYPADGSVVILVNLNNTRASNDPYGWGHSRTMSVAHEYIEREFDSLKDGDVIDVEFILGETTEKKISERFER